ncbi:prolipoprotein diacylglyceryl transferase [Candidatus Falkowbacteria bacterium HGW-Falkowbacteria-2]|uniref:Phosphatidylglycerol--prolipoprotein diacylglyceryl transferase n=1 Tax=Candidatus Falkowbacteria bacterium HGW-Falkowbacteria-2 TaxID=2013769 RepID=A0A2N2E3N4_9BACT|nr:MAG: prolipoprotein diacylglyceryl transferase [Candidatus Falkowbacteria bacterium HGW-Falkowbacteria-2]
MIYFLHNFIPDPILLSVGPINIRWYGLILAVAMAAAIVTSVYVARRHKIERDPILDLSIWVIIGGLLGARIYEIFLELPYYLTSPISMFKIWEGGLAIHGGIIGGALALYFFAKRYHYNALKLAAIITPGLALGQSLGRFANWFNQELFGLPTHLPWGIPIEITNRPNGFEQFQYFHPTFLYESVGSLILFFGLLYLINRLSDLNHKHQVLVVCAYLIGYSLLRFFLEFIKIDPTPILFGLRWPQIASLIFITIATTWLTTTLKTR